MEIRSYSEIKRIHEKKAKNEATIADVEEEIKTLKEGTISIAVEDGRIKNIEKLIAYRW